MSIEPIESLERENMDLKAEVTRLNKLLTLETSRAMQAEAQHFKALQELDELEVEVTRIQTELEKEKTKAPHGYVRKEMFEQTLTSLSDARRELDKAGKRVKELEEREGNFKVEIARLRNDLLASNKRIEELEKVDG